MSVIVLLITMLKRCKGGRNHRSQLVIPRSLMRGPKGLDSSAKTRDALDVSRGGQRAREGIADGRGRQYRRNADHSHLLEELAPVHGVNCICYLPANFVESVPLGSKLTLDLIEDVVELLWASRPVGQVEGCVRLLPGSLKLGKQPLHILVHPALS